MTQVSQPSPAPPPFPRLRPDLRLRCAPGGATLIEDPMGGGFYEADVAAAEFLRRLDGRRDPAGALALAQADGAAAGLDATQAAAALAEAGRLGLLAGGAPGAPVRPARQRLSLVSQRLSLGARQGLFDALAALARPLFGPVGWLGWTALLILGVAALAQQWSGFLAELSGLFSAHGAALMLAAWTLSKLWHELCHGVVARRHGVPIRDTGVLFILLAPLGAYVDVSDVWRLQDRWRRLHVTAAGIAGEFALGAAAVLLWAQTGPGDLRAFLQALAVTAVVGAALFNLNPLMRFDAYHALVDLLRAPNLYQRAAEATRLSGLRMLAGRAAAPVQEAGWVRLYGGASLLWRLALAATLTALATTYAFGLGLALGVAAAWMLVIAPLGRFFAALWALGPRARATSALRVSVAAAAVVLVLRAPAPTPTGGPAILAFREAVEARAETRGRVVATLVRQGERVTLGQPLLRMEDPALDAALARLRARAGAALLNERAARASGAMAAAADAAGNARVAQAEIARLEGLHAGLTLRAPASGVALSADIAALEGRWLARGEAAIEIGDPDALEVRAWLTPEAAEALARAPQGYVFRALGDPGDGAAVSLSRIAPSAGRAPPPPALTAAGGGPLDLDLSGPEPRLSTPRVEARLALDRMASSATAVAGMPGRLRGPAAWRPLGAVLAARLDRAIAGIDPRAPDDWARALLDHD